MHKFLFLIFLSANLFSQTKTITGVISDDSNKPLESANVIAKLLTEIKNQQIQN
jgi:hypothetical protein